MTEEVYNYACIVMMDVIVAFNCGTAVGSSWSVWISRTRRSTRPPSKRHSHSCLVSVTMRLIAGAHRRHRSAGRERRRWWAGLSWSDRLSGTGWL